MRKKQDRCTGHCCMMFYLPMGPGELMGRYHKWKVSGEVIGKNGLTPDQKVPRDIHLIAPMVTYLGFFKKPPIKKVNPDGQTDGAHYYTCKHFDQKKKVCTIYEIRPEMCRAYPYGCGCNYASCTWTSRKAKKVTLAELNRMADKKMDPGGKTESQILLKPSRPSRTKRK